MQKNWGHARIIMKTQQKKPDIFVATGKQYSIKQFINLTAKKLKMNRKKEKERLMTPKFQSIQIILDLYVITYQMLKKLKN